MYIFFTMTNFLRYVILFSVIFEFTDGRYDGKFGLEFEAQRTITKTLDFH